MDGTGNAEARGRFASIARIALSLAVLALLVAFFGSGAHRELDPASLRARVHALGAFGPLAYVAAFALLQPLGPSGHLFTVAASLLWPPHVAFALGLTGAVASQTTSFTFYRYVAADWARARIPERLARYERALVERPFAGVLVLRLVTFTWPLVPALLGVSRVRFWPMFYATVLGLAPTVFLGVLLGTRLFGFVREVARGVFA